MGVFGSLHTYPPPTDLQQYDFFIPDTFAVGSECFPKNVETFQSFNLAMARASARNVSTAVPWRETLAFLSALPDLGVKPQTVVDIGRQLVSEKMNHAKTCRRRTYQVVLAFDIFMKQLAKTKPDFCTFFTNHVASSMHRYWAALFPGDYAVFKHQPEWVDTYKIRCNHVCIGQAGQDAASLVRFVDDTPSFSFCGLPTSMGQAATTAVPCESELFVKDDAKFASFIGLEKMGTPPGNGAGLLA